MPKDMKRLSPKGFTLIELLVVIGIIAILAAIVAIAVNPGRQYGQARDAQRWSDINAILNAVHQYVADNEGTFPAGLPAVTAFTIAADDSNPATQEYDLCPYIYPTYLPSLPSDPLDQTTHFWGGNCASYNTGYTIILSGGRVTIAAPEAEVAASISLTR